ncbi:hypothetical protein [Sphingomonas crusticola]|uniref:hypothetical protein n=1 Tax=Sphingomonas crusticola TaxID=1697973 RepID=UPI000E245883|nr:hypothetical protein [Sphingomonas crusticola]
MRSLMLGVAVLIAAASPAAARQSLQERGEAELAKEVSGLIPGPPEKCLMLSRIVGSHIIDGTAIVYRTLGGKVYVNRPRGAEMLREDDIPVQFVYGSELCRLDRIKLLDRTSRMERGFAGLGDFVPYTKPAKAR